ncbi:MAG: sigma-70 family RNA polymerase sigma factor [Anaerolineae bacterium]|nr:sigma-70 family RNA polymerase sigma factor [Anaerolineae bacterium]
MRPDSDIDVLRAIAQGSQQAITELYDRHARHLLNYLAHLTGDADAAEDLVQELFVVVWRDARRFRGQSSVRTWLFGIAHNLGITALRRSQTLPLDEFAADSLADPGPDPDALVALASDRERLAQAMQALPAAHRAVIELVFDLGLGQAEVARVLGCPLGTVKSRLHYTLRALARTMREQDGNLS